MYNQTNDNLLVFVHGITESKNELSWSSFPESDILEKKIVWNNREVADLINECVASIDTWKRNLDSSGGGGGLLDLDLDVGD